MPTAVGQPKPLGGAEAASDQADRKAKEPGATEANGVFDGVVIDADAAVLHGHLELGSEVEGVSDGQTHGALWQVGAVPLQAAHGLAEAFEDHAALAGTDGLTGLGTGAGLVPLGLDAVKIPDLQEDKSGVLRGVGVGFGFGFEKLAADVRPAGGKTEVLEGAGKGGLGSITIALHGAPVQSESG